VSPARAFGSVRRGTSSKGTLTLLATSGPETFIVIDHVQWPSEN